MAAASTELPVQMFMALGQHQVWNTLGAASIKLLSKCCVQEYHKTMEGPLKKAALLLVSMLLQYNPV